VALAMPPAKRHGCLSSTGKEFRSDSGEVNYVVSIRPGYTRGTNVFSGDCFGNMTQSP